MIAYKLVRQRKDGSLGPLFINCPLRIPIGEWLEAETHHRRKGYAYRPGWHVTFKPHAPHLSTKGRVWVEVEIEDFERYKWPESQGGMWGLAKKMKVNKILEGQT